MKSRATSMNNNVFFSLIRLSFLWNALLKFIKESVRNSFYSLNRMRQDENLTTPRRRPGKCPTRFPQTRSPPPFLHPRILYRNGNRLSPAKIRRLEKCLAPLQETNFRGRRQPPSQRISWAPKSVLEVPGKEVQLVHPTPGNPCKRWRTTPLWAWIPARSRGKNSIGPSEITSALDPNRSFPRPRIKSLASL